MSAVVVAVVVGVVVVAEVGMSVGTKQKQGLFSFHGIAMSFISSV